MFKAAALTFITVHFLQIGVSLSDVLDGLIMRDSVVSISSVLVMLALAEVVSVLVIDVLLFRRNKDRISSAIQRYWLVCSVLTLVLAVSPVPEAPVITFEADKFFFRMLPIYLITPQAAIQILVHSVFRAIQVSAETWIVQYGGFLFCASHLVYMTWLSIRRKN